MIKDISKWLRQAPKKSEIVEIQNGKDKVKIIPQKIIETLLDELTEQNWSTRNFQFSRTTETIVKPYADNSGSYPAERTMCDASLELVVNYRVMVLGSITDKDAPVFVEKEITRVLVGAVSFDVSFFGNDHIANTAKSLAIANAASDLGNRFGKSLNPKEASMMILGMKKPLQPVSEVFSKDKISETLDKLTKDIKK